MNRTRGRDASGATATAVLDIAERLVQTRGFNGFSYADVASELSVTKASLHYHFPSKAELGEALIDRYIERFAASLAEIESSEGEAGKRLESYAGLYADVLHNERMCLCGMLAAEYETLPEPMRAAIVRFFELNEAWLARVLTEGRRGRGLSFDGSPQETARGIVSGLEGGMLIARAQGDLARFRPEALRLVANLAGVA